MSELIVAVEEGKLLGKLCLDIDNNPFFSFQGIPYAKPPQGNLRFQPPQPTESWFGIRDATKEGSECCSKHMFTNKFVGSENCLFLNVYTKNIPYACSTTYNILRPVMVWIHGGGFRTGSSKTDTYGPDYLLTQDIVLVTLNYRLGIFGFLSLEDQSLGISGNAGLKDMVMALTWVKRNIRNFLGDPNNVTIFGESAGGAAVHYLVLSQLAKNLFHKAILQSGCALNMLAKGQRNQCDTIAYVLGLKYNTENEIFQKLMVMSAEELFALSEKVFLLDPLNKVFAPVVENASSNAFITEEPLKIIKSGNYNNVPMIFGYNTLEGTLIQMIMNSNRASIPEDFEKIIPSFLQAERGTENSKSIAQKIRKFYYGEDASENEVQKSYTLHTDNSILRDLMFAVRHHVVTSIMPVYLYRISLETRLNIFKKLHNIDISGVAHGDDIGYLFKTQISPELKPGSLEYISVKRFVQYWTNFAKDGNPNSERLEDCPLWKPVNGTEINFVDIGQEIVTGTNPETERIQFWDDIFSLNPLYLFTNI